MRHARWCALAGVPIAAVLVGSVAFATPKLPTAGTATAVAKAVAASPKIQKLSPTITKQINGGANDNPAVYYPQTKSGCTALTSCVFGDKKSTKVLVILGDSHAQMWIPALNRIGTSKQLKVIVLYMARCPAATLDVWLPGYNIPYLACSSTRANWFTAINKLHPVATLLTDHTNGVTTAASNGTQPFTSSQWQAGMASTISSLKPSKSKVAIIGDINTFDQPPLFCLSAYPSQAQTCSSKNPNPDRPTQIAAERAAASAAGVLYVDPTKWLCTAKTCSTVVGSYIVYYDSYHVSCRYAAYLSGVLQTALKKVL